MHVHTKINSQEGISTYPNLRLHSLKARVGVEIMPTQINDLIHISYLGLGDHVFLTVTWVIQ